MGVSEWAEGVFVGTEQQAVMHCVQSCAMSGEEWTILNSDRGVLWQIERDTKVDDEDLTYPVIVHMREGRGTLDEDSPVLLVKTATTREL